MDAKLKSGAAALVVVVLISALGYLLLVTEPASDPEGPGGSRPGAQSPRPSAGPKDPGADKGPGISVQPGPAQRPGSEGPGPQPQGAEVGGPGYDTDPTPGPDGPQALQLVCVDDQGQPLRGVRIEAKRRSGMPLEPVISDGQGRAYLRGLPRGEQVAGLARHPSAAAPARFGPVAVEPGAIVKIQLAPAQQGRLRGKIVDEVGGPVTEAEVVLVNPQEEQAKVVLDPAALQLGPDGSFVVQVAAGKYAISARSKTHSESDRDYVTVPADGESPEVLLRVSRKASLGGSLELPPDVAQLRPLELDVLIEITSGTERNPLTRVERRTLRPDASLRFELQDIPPGKVRLRLELPRAGDTRVGPWTSLTVQPGQSQQDLVLALREVVVSILGQVKDDEGVAVMGVVVEAEGRKVMTDRDGRYAIRGLDMGAIGVKATKQGHASAYQLIQYEGATQTVNLTLARFGSVRGRVTGEIVAGVVVTVVKNEEGAVETYGGKTDASGTYVIEGIPPGTYYVKAGKGADLFSASGAPTVSVPAGRQASVSDIELR